MKKKTTQASSDKSKKKKKDGVKAPLKKKAEGGVIANKKDKRWGENNCGKKKKDFVDSAGTDMNSHNFFHANMCAVSLPVLYRRHADAAKFKEECNNL